MHGARRRAAGRPRRAGLRRPRDDAAGGLHRQDPRAREAEVDRRLPAEGGRLRPMPGGRARSAVARLAPDHDLLARRRRPLHHAPGRHHERPADRDAQRRHVPRAEVRRDDDGHALADPQGRCVGLARHGRADGRGDRARDRPGHLLHGVGAAPQAHRRVHARRLPAWRAGRAREVQDGRPRGAGPVRDRDRGLHREGRAARRGPVRRPHGLLHAGRAVPGRPRHVRRPTAATRSTRRSSSACRRRRTCGSARRPSDCSCPPSA